MHERGEMRSLQWIVAGFGSLLVPAIFCASAFAAGIDDVVILKNGGRLRGVVVEEDPVKGVRIKLADGTIRTLKPDEVSEVRYDGKPAAPVPPAPVPLAPPPYGTAVPAPYTPPPNGTPVPAPYTPPPYGTPVPAPYAPPPYAPVPYAPPSPGTLHVEAGAEGNIMVDGGQVGRAPLDVGGLLPGKHRVRIDFDAGGHRETIVIIQPGQTLRWFFEKPVPSNVKPFQLEGGAYLGYGTSLSGPPSANPFGFGIGARAGILFYRVYLGADVTYFVGTSSFPYTDGNGNLNSYTSNAVSVAPRAGYDIHFNDGFVTVAARPYVGVEAVFLPSYPVVPTSRCFGCNLSTNTQLNPGTDWNFAPGILVSAGIGDLFYAGVDARLSVGSDAASFSVFATGGVRLF